MIQRTQGTLEREKLNNNLIDQLYSLTERLARLEEKYQRFVSAPLVIPEPETGGRWTAYIKDMGGEVGPVIVIKEL